MSENKNANRWRCNVVGCNPVLFGTEAANAHENLTGHKTSRWPMRSPEGQRRAEQRNKSGYYDKYNVGPKSPEVRFRYLDRKRRQSVVENLRHEYIYGEDDF